MIKKYSKLIPKERIQIEKLLSLKKNFTEIAIALNRSKSTTTRELKRFGNEPYFTWQATFLSAP